MEKKKREPLGQAIWIEEDTGRAEGGDRVRDRVLSGFVLANPPTNTPARFM